MKLKWRDFGNGVWQSRHCGYELWVHRNAYGGFCAVAEFFGQQNREADFATEDEAKAEAEKMLLKMVEAMEERIKQIKEQL